MKYLLILLLTISTLTACTTGEDSSDGIEEELESEMEEMADGEATTVEAAEEDATQEDASDEEVADKEKNADGDDELDGEDDEFLAEDSSSPAAPNTDKLEEKDLQNELEKENMVAAKNENVGVTPAEPIPPSNNPPPPMAPPVVAVDPAALAQPNSAVTASATTEITDDGFEVINPPPLPQEDLGVPAPLVADVDPPLPSEKAAKELVPLSKIEQKTFMRNGRLINTIYFVRANEDLGAISQKIFNEDKTAVLVADNDFVLKGLEPGDRIYYNSPNRPTDDKLMLTYYEDNKMPPQYYVTRKGDDIKKIGREVLGTELGWKEIWSTNEVLQSQALLPAGLKIRYWSGSEPRLSEATGPSLAATTPSDDPSPTTVMPEPTPETLPDLPASPDPVVMPSEDPGLAAAAALSPASNGPSLPSVESPVKAQEETSLMTVAAIAMIGLAGLAIVAIQIKNRKKDSGALPPSLEFTKV